MSLLTDALQLGYDREKTMFLFSAIDRGLSGNKAITALKNSALGGLRRSRAQAILRIARKTKKARKYVSYVRLDRLLNPDRLSLSPYHHVRNYNYIIKIRGKSALTGEKMTKNVTISTDHLITKNQALEFAAANIGLEDYEIMDNPDYKVENVLLGGSYLPD